MPHRILTRNQDLEDFCAACKGSPYITVDTEFLREKTYFPQLCLIQLGKPETKNSKALAVAVDPLSEDINLFCLEKLFFDDKMIKVFHAARQDLEIIMQLFDGRLPAPLFDTQIAAMVTGHGDQVGYQSLVKQICNVELDKSHQYTNWSKRPLSSKQVDYALADVTYLRDIYESLQSRLIKTNRDSWVKEELSSLSDPNVIQVNPADAWERVKVRTDKPKILVVLKCLAEWREMEAVAQDRPRHFILRDEVLAELAKQAPNSEKDLENIRGLPEKYKAGAKAKRLLALISQALQSDKVSWPKRPLKKGLPQDLIPALEMLKMLLRIQSAEYGVVPRLIASPQDLEDFLMSKKREAMPLMQGWRYDIFGQYVDALLEGKLALKLEDRKVIHQSL